MQGPLSRDILAPLLFVQPTQPAFANAKWFGGCVARLHERRGVPLYVCRTGYTGELGYELFCDARDAEAVWDAVAVADAGGERAVPMGSDALNMLRIESGLMAMGSEWGDCVDAFDAGLGFAVNLDKADFIGKDALARNAKNPRQKLVGLVLDGGESAAHGDSVYPTQGSTSAIGVITSSVFSPALQKPIALARIAIEHAADGTPTSIGKLDGRAKRLAASVTAIPFVDPQRQRPRS